MTREELRKKRKEIAESNGYKGYVPRSVREGTRQKQEVRNPEPVQEKKSTWSNVMQRIGNTMDYISGGHMQEKFNKNNSLVRNDFRNPNNEQQKNKSLQEDVRGQAKIVGQSVKKSGLSILNYIENATSNNFSNYREREKRLGEAEYIKQQEEKGQPVVSVRNDFRNQALENYGFAEDYGAEQAGNIDINHRKVKKNKDGSISTEKSITIGAEVDGKEKYFVIPTIIDGKQVSDKEAEEHFFKTHEHLGMFADSDKANKYAEDLHNRQNEFYNDNGARIIGASATPTPEPVQENKSTWQKITDRVNTIANSTPGRFIRKEIEIGKSIAKPITSPTEYARDEIVTNIGKGINRIKQGNVSEAFKGWVDKGALSDGYQFGDVTRSAVATTQDIGKQVVKGGVAEPGEALGDLMSIAQAGYNEYIKGDKKRADAILKKASESHADDIASGIMGGIGTAFKYLAPGQKKRLLLEVGHALANKQNVGQSLKDSVMNTFKNKYGYYKDIEGQSFLGEAGENTVSSMSSNATQRFIQEQIGIPWQSQMALKTMPETYLEKRVNKGMSTGKSMLSSLTDFGIEWFTEEMFDGIKFAGTGHGTVNQFLNANINKIEDNVARTSLQYLKGVYGEGAEEVIGDYLSAISDYLIENYGEKELSLDDIKQIIIDVSKDPQTLKDFMSGSLSVLGQDVYTGGANIRGQYRNEQRKQGIIESNLTQKEKQTLIDSMENETSEKPSEKELKKQEETKTKVNEILNKLGDEDRAVVQYALEQNDIAKTISESDLSNEDKNMLFTFAENQKSSLEEVKNAIEDIKNDNYDFINQKQDTTTQNETVLPQAQQTNQLPTKQAENETSSEIEDKGLNLAKSIDNFNKSVGENEKIFDLNDEKTKKEIEGLQKIANEGNVSIEIDRTPFEKNGVKDTKTNAFYEYDKDGKLARVVLNPHTNTRKYVQNLVMHEMYHSFTNQNKEGKDLKLKDKLRNTIIDNAQRKAEFEDSINDLYNTYGKTYASQLLGKNVQDVEIIQERDGESYIGKVTFEDGTTQDLRKDKKFNNQMYDMIEEEAVANILGEKLGNQEFVEELVNGKYKAENKGLVEKIYDFIKNQINRFTGYKDQEQYWKHVKELFDNAYRNAEKNQGQSFSKEATAMTNITDSQGRNLSQGQVDYFKDSKVRDESGNLIPMYHSTNADFTVFDKSKLGDNTAYGNTSFGFFVTSNKTFSERFQDIDNEGKQGKTMEVYIDSKKPIVHPYNASYKYSGEELDRITREWLEATDEAEGIEQLEEMVAEGESESLYDAYMEMTFADDPYVIAEQERQILESKGYDAVEFVEGLENTVIEGSTSDNPVSSYAVFNSNQIKNVDNVNPTESQDIRYSKETSTTDNQGNKINLPSNLDYSSNKNLTSDIFKDYNVDKIIGKNLRSDDSDAMLDKMTEYSKRGTKLAEKHGHYSLDYNDIGVRSQIENGILSTGIYDIDNNFVVLTTTKEGNKLFIDELYVENQNQGTGTKVVNALKEYADKAGLELIPHKELSTAKGFWDKVLGRNTETSTKDSQGRELSKEQQEYFKESKARDDNGNLLEVYHGTNNDFNKFDISYLGSASGDLGYLGDGFYVATHKGEAGYYGSKVMNGYVNITNPYNIKQLTEYNGKKFEGENTSVGLEIKNLVDLNKQWADIEINDTTYGEIAKATDDFLKNAEVKNLGVVEDYDGNDSGIMWGITYDGKTKEIESILDYSESQMKADALNDYIREKYGYIRGSDVLQYITSAKNFNPDMQTFREFLQSKGYDSIIQDTPQTTDEIVLFNSNQFKNIDNQNPTDNADIRYSKDTTGAWNNFIEKYFKNEGTGTAIKDMKKLPVKTYSMQDLDKVLNESNLSEELKEEFRNDPAIKGQVITQEIFDEYKKAIKQVEKDYESYNKEQEQKRFERKNYNDESRLELIKQKRKEFNKNMDYDDTAVTELDEIIPKNRNGKRTVPQYKNMAKEIGKRIANMSPEQIEDIAVKSYLDLQPTKNITRYDNVNKTNLGFEELYANDWINAVYEGVRENRQYSIETEGKLPQADLSNDEDLQAIREHHERELGDTISLNDIPNLPDLNENNKLEGELPRTIDRIVEKRTKPKPTLSEFVKEFKKQFVNKGYAVDKLADATKNQQLKYKYDRQLMAFNEAQVSLGDAQVDTNGRVIGDSLIDVFKKADKSKLGKYFADYLENKNNIARDKLGENLYGAEVTAVQSRKIVEEYEKKYPQFKEWADNVSKYNDNLAQTYLVGSFIDQDLWTKLKTLNPDYVPAFRDIVETRGLPGAIDNVGFQVLRRAEGGNSNILTPKEAMAEQTLQYVKAFRKNETIKELYKTLKNQLADTDVIYDEVDTVPDMAFEMMKEAIGRDENGNYTATFFDNGKATTFKVSKDIYDAFVQSKAIQDIENNALTKVIGGTVRNVAGFQRNAVTTYSIPFMLKNMVRDYNDALINTKYSDLRFMKNYARAYWQMATGGDLYKQYKNLGGGANTYYDYEKGLLPQKTINPVKNFLKVVTGFNEYIEQAPRLAEFMSTLEKGGTVDEALYNSAEVTTNFKRGGDTAKLINKYGANFLNASIQGTDKLVRNITGQNGVRGYANLLVKATIAGIAPSMLNHLLISASDDDEEKKAYDDLQQYIKDNYYLFYKGNGEFFRIPKGRVAGTIGDTAVRLYRATQGDDKAFDDYFKDVILENIAPNNPLTNNIIAPVLQAKNNDAWYDGTIYNESKYSNKLPMEVTDEKVDDLSNLIAKGVNAVVDNDTLMRSKTENRWLDVIANPKKLNYILDQYSGGFGDLIMPTFTPQAENNVFTDQFTTSSVLKNKYINEFYDMCDNNLGKSEYATDFDKLTYKYLNDASKEIGKLYSEKHGIQLDDTLSDKEKKQQVSEVQKKINSLAENTVKTIQDTKVSGNTASFDGTTYYKDNDDEWKKVSEDDKISGISDKTYASYKNKIASANKKKKDTEGKNLTDKEKIQILNNGAYTNKEKDLIYSQDVGKDDDTYSAYKDFSNNVEEYLTYKSQTFESDKVDDGTVKGKSVTKGEGTKQNKIKSYLENSSFTPLERLYIYGTTYKLSEAKGERDEFQRLLAEKNLSQEQVRKIMLNLNGVVEMNDGSIAWK